MKPLLKYSLIILCAYLSINLIFFVIIYLIISGYTHLPVPPPIYSPSDHSLEFREFTVENEDGLKIVCWHIAPKNQKGTVIIASGNMGRRDTHLWEAKYLSDAGYSTVLFDYQGVGDSDGIIRTYGYKESLDIKAIIEYLNKGDELKDKPIFLYGNSMGVATVLLAGKNFPEINGYILNSGYTSFYDAIKDKTRWWGHPVLPAGYLAWLCFYIQTGINPDECSSIKPLSSIHSPVFIIHGKKDMVMNYSHSQEIYKSWKGEKELWLVEDAHHCIFEREPPEGVEEEYKQRVVQFINKCCDK
jgi:hypothetical protein